VHGALSGLHELLRDADGSTTGCYACAEVSRANPNGSVLGVDEWEASCKDRNAYSVSVLAELNEAIITSLSCHELSATSKMLLQMSGSRSKAARCKLKSTRRGLYRAVAFVP
jgi:hypothetical protein